MAFKGFSSRDPTLTEQRRLFYMRQLNKIYREYSRDAQAIVKLNPEIKRFIMMLDKASLQTNTKGAILARDLVQEAYKSGMYRADIVSGSILSPEIAKGPGLGLTSGVPGMLGHANIEAIEILTERTFNGIVGMTDELAKKVKFQMTEGMLEGKGMPGIARGVAKTVRGDLWKAKRLVRTEYVNAHNQAAFRRYQDYGFTHYGISVEECEPECDICPPHIGKVYKFGQGPVPPLHPNCRCSIYPITER